MNDALQKLVVELRLLRESVQRIESVLASGPPARKRPKKEPLTAERTRQLYQEIRERFLKDRDTGKLEELLSYGYSDLRLFFSENNLPIDPRGNKQQIRSDFIKLLNEEGQIRRTDPIHRSTQD
jgi:hypothetical protein